MKTVYTNEIDKKAVHWLSQLPLQFDCIDDRSIKDVTANDVRGFTQCHFFAGIGGWSLALQIAGWPDQEPVWTGSCPCQPFSAAGKRKGVDDDRHLWPEFRRLIAECLPPTIFGEQVASKDGRQWLSDVRADLEALGYAVGAADLCAAGSSEEAEGWFVYPDGTQRFERYALGAPHIRQRLYWGAVRLADAERIGLDRCWNERTRWRDESANSRDPHRVADTSSAGPQGRQIESAREECQAAERSGDVCRLAYAESDRGRSNFRPIRSGETAGIRTQAGKNARRTSKQTGRAIYRSSASECQSAEKPSQEHSAKCAGVGERPEHAESNGREQGRSEPIRRIAAVRLGEGFWGECDFVYCTDGKYRPVEPGTFPLAHGVSGRVAQLRGLGNAIVPQIAAEFIAATMDFLFEQPQSRRTNDMPSDLVTFESSELVDESTSPTQETETASEAATEQEISTEEPSDGEVIAQDKQLVDDELDLLTPEQQSELIDLIEQLCQANDDIAEAEDELAEVNKELTELKGKATGINSKIEELKDLRQGFLDEICGFRDAAPRTVKALESGSRKAEPDGKATNEDGWRRESLAVALQYGTIEKFGPKKQGAMKQNGLLTVGDLFDWQAKASNEGVSLHELFQRNSMGIGVDSVNTIEDRMAGYVAKWVVQNQPPKEFGESEQVQASEPIPAQAPAPSKPPANPELDLPEPPAPKASTPEPSAPSEPEPQDQGGGDGNPVQEAIDVLVEHFKTNKPQRMLANDSSPWDFGNIAAARDMPMTDCPYSPDSEEFVDWIAGYVNELNMRAKYGRGESLPGPAPKQPEPKSAAKLDVPAATAQPEPETSYSTESADDADLPGIDLDFDPMSL